MPSVEDLKICYVNYNIDRECVASIFKVSSSKESEDGEICSETGIFSEVPGGLRLLLWHVDQGDVHDGGCQDDGVWGPQQ